MVDDNWGARLMAVETKVDQLRDTVSLHAEALEGNRYWPGIITQMQRLGDKMERLSDDIESLDKAVEPYKDLPRRVNDLHMGYKVLAAIVAITLVIASFNSVVLAVHILGGG